MFCRFSPGFHIHAKNITRELTPCLQNPVQNAFVCHHRNISPSTHPAPSLAVAQWHRIHTWQYNQVENYLFSCHQNINIVNTQNTTDHYNCYKLGQRTSNFETHCLDRAESMSGQLSIVMESWWILEPLAQSSHLPLVGGWCWYWRMKMQIVKTGLQSAKSYFPSFNWCKYSSVYSLRCNCAENWAKCF